MLLVFNNMLHNPYYVEKDVFISYFPQEVLSPKPVVGILKRVCISSKTRLLPYCRGRPQGPHPANSVWQSEGKPQPDGSLTSCPGKSQMPPRALERPSWWITEGHLWPTAHEAHRRPHERVGSDSSPPTPQMRTQPGQHLNSSLVRPAELRQILTAETLR